MRRRHPRAALSLALCGMVVASCALAACGTSPRASLASPPAATKHLGRAERPGALSPALLALPAVPPAAVRIHRVAAAVPHRAGTNAPSSPRHASRPTNVYVATESGEISPSLRHVPKRIYVPNSGDGTVDVIDPSSHRFVGHFAVGLIPHHVTPSWDMSRLYVDNEGSSSLTVIDPRSSRPVGLIRVPFPYNLYFTPDGKAAIVVVERLSRLDFRDPHSWKLISSVYIPWPGIDHLDFSWDGHYLLGSAEWSGIVVKVDTHSMKIAGVARVGGLPVDVRLSPDGSVFYVANQGRSGVSIVDPVKMKEIGFIPTGAGAHGLALSRDTRSLYVSNRREGTISVISMATRRVTATWHVGGTPDMLQVSPDGHRLWVTSRYGSAVEQIDTHTGAVLHVLRAGIGPHGLCYFPNVGKYSLGHNGMYR